LERTRIGRFNVRRLSVALAPHPDPLPRERELVTALAPLPRERELVTALAPHPGPLPRERELVTMYRPLVSRGGDYGLAGRCQKNPSL
jgi:hypothetical protein